MVDKSLLERLQADAKRHRAPQVDILPSWVKSGEKSAIVTEPVATAKPLVDSKLEATKKAEKERKIEKKPKKKKK